MYHDYEVDAERDVTMAINRFNIQNSVNRLLSNENKKDDVWDRNLLNRTDRIYGRESNNSDTGSEANDITSIFPKVRNPFSSNNSLVRNASIMNTDKLNNKTRSFIDSIFNSSGVLRNPDTYSSNSISTSENSGAYCDTDNTSAADSVSSAFTGNTDGSDLGNMDVKNELPKLSENQISTIIKQHFGNSNVISPNDAQGIYNAQQNTGMSALAILGIGALESGWGTSSIANKTNNLWGYGASNDNPEGNAHRYSQMAQGAQQFAEEYMKDYYNGYGAKSINSAGTGSNPKGMGYAYNNDGSISSTWAPDVDSIMNKLYNTAKGAGEFSTAASPAYTAADNSASQRTSRAKNIMNTFLNRQSTSGKGYNANGGINRYFTVMPASLHNTLFGNRSASAMLDTSDYSDTSDDSSGSGGASLSDTAPGGSGKSSVKSSGNGSNIVANAEKYKGTPYVWGGESMAEGGMDCSGFVYNALRDSGYDVGRETAEGYRHHGTSVAKSDMQPGDLVFYGKNGDASHIGIYIGNGQMIHSSGGSKNTASNPGKGVSITNVDYRNDFLEARRY